MAKILCLCTYPVSVPRHGGQIRVNAIQRMYGLAGHEVRHLALYRADEYPEEPTSGENINFSWSFINELEATGGRTDVNASDYLFKDAAARERFQDFIRMFEPDIIQLEHCWLWPALKSFLSTRAMRFKPILIYSSQNVEYQLISSSSLPGKKKVSGKVVDLVRRMELDLVRSADLVVAVSEDDATFFGASAKSLLIAPNGIWPPHASTGQDYWHKELNARRIALFVGSAHPPNSKGFVELLGPTFGYLAPNERIVVVGGVCNLLRIDPSFRESIGLNLSRCTLAGVQDAGGLATLLDMADVVLVPITEGGGTNIKMAEALYNRKLVICTSKATRGYEQYLNLPFVLVRDTPEKFRQTLLDVLRGRFNPIASITREQAEKLDDLLWSSTLLPLTERAELLISKSTATVASIIK